MISYVASMVDGSGMLNRPELLELNQAIVRMGLSSGNFKGVSRPDVRGRQQLMQGGQHVAQCWSCDVSGCTGRLPVPVSGLQAGHIAPWQYWAHVFTLVDWQCSICNHDASRADSPHGKMTKALQCLLAHLGQADPGDFEEIAHLLPPSWRAFPRASHHWLRKAAGLA